jgi:hypothetical protein
MDRNTKKVEVEMSRALWNRLDEYAGRMRGVSVASLARHLIYLGVVGLDARELRDDPITGDEIKWH